MSQSKLFIFISLYIALVIYTLRPIHVVEPELQGKINLIDNLINANCNNPEDLNRPFQTVYEFTDLPTNVIGLCNTLNHYYKIQIDKTYWAFATEREKFSLIAHEMTHCVLDMNEHSNDRDNYMYYALNPSLSIATITNQIIENTKKVCNE